MTMVVRYGDGDKPAALLVHGIAGGQFAERRRRNAVLRAQIGQAVFIAGYGIGEGLRDGHVHAFAGQEINCDGAPRSSACFAIDVDFVDADEKPDPASKGVSNVVAD